MKKLWVSAKKFTGQVNVDDQNKIVFTPNVWHKFVGQPLPNLINWLTRLSYGQPVHVVEFK